MGLKEFLTDFGSSISNLLGFGYGVYQDQRNFNYQKNLQEQLFARDDTAIQRRMADLSAAGINPLLAGSISGAGNSSAGIGSFAPTLPTYDVLQKKAQVKQNKILDKKSDEQDAINEGLWLDNEEKKLKNKILEKQFDTMDSMGFYPFSALGKWSTDANSMLGQFLSDIFGGASFNLLRPRDTAEKVFDSLPTVDPGNPLVVLSDRGARALNKIKGGESQVSSHYRESSETNKKLASTLDKTWKDVGYRVNFHNGKFTVEDFNSRPPVQYDFSTYQEASQFIWSQQR